MRRLVVEHCEHLGSTSSICETSQVEETTWRGERGRHIVDYTSSHRSIQSARQTGIGYHGFGTSNENINVLCSGIIVEKGDAFLAS